MKNNYPRYVRFELEKIYDGLPSLEKADIEEFLKYCKITAGQKKIEDIKRSIVQFRDIIEKPLSQSTLEDLRGYLSLLNSKSGREKYTKNGLKSHIRRYLEYKFKDWSERFEAFKDIKLQNGFNEKKINEGTILKKPQIEKIMKKEHDILKKTYFLTLYQSGLRPGELRDLLWKNVDLNTDGEISDLHIYATKTGKARTVYIKEASFYLARLKENATSEYVFPSLENDKEPISKATANRWISDMGKAVKIKAFPMLLRHSRATELYTNLPSKIAQKFMGHGKDMSDIYSHISSKELKESMLRTVYSFQELPPEQKDKMQGEIDTLKQKLSNKDKIESVQNEMNDINQKILMLVLQKPKSAVKEAQSLMAQMAKLKSKIEKYRKNQPEDTEDRYVAYTEDENKKKVILN